MLQDATRCYKPTNKKNIDTNSNEQKRTKANNCSIESPASLADQRQHQLRKINLLRNKYKGC